MRAAGLIAWWRGAALAMAAALALPAGAAPRTEERIVIGVEPAASALSYLADNGKYVGLHLDICRRIIHRYSEATGRRTRIVYKPVASDSRRVADVASGAVQLDCGATTNTMVRQEKVDFLPTTYVLESRIAVPSGSPITSMADLDGKRIAVTAGSNAEQAMRRLLHEEKVSATTVPVRGLDDMIRLLGRHEVDAVAAETDRLVSVLIRKHASAPLKVRFVGRPVLTEPLGIMMSNRPLPLRTLAYAAVVELMTSGEMARLYHAWFESDIPAPLARLDLPPSDATRRAWARPTTQPANIRSQF